MKKSLLVMATALALALGMLTPAMAVGHCQPTGAGGLTANYVNEVPDDPFDVTCDIGIYVDEPGPIDGATINGTVAAAKSVQYGIYVDGVDADVTNATISVADDYPHQFVSITYRDGASGSIADNTLSGAHRAAIVVRGVGTSATITRNEVVGTGPKTSGWAENGIQVDQGAGASITHNLVADHWWDGESNWASTAVMLFGASDSAVNNNTLTDNEFGVYLYGDGNEAKANRIESQVISQSSLEFQAFGILVVGDDNTLIGNQMRATNGSVGIYVFGGSANTTIRGGNIRGFDTAIYDGGDDSVFTGNPSLMD